MVTIKFSDESDLLLKSGAHFIGELKQDAERVGASQTIQEDWKTVASWLGHMGGPLNREIQQKLERGWAAYLAIGLAPSHQLQKAFDHFAGTVRAAQTDRPPTEVMNVFDRLMATDEQIREKRGADWAAEHEKFAPIFAGMKKGAHPENIWRRQSPTVRLWLFGSAVWSLAVLLYALIFDPFDGGGWARMTGSETLRVAVVALIPIAAGLVVSAYQRWVR